MNRIIRILTLQSSLIFLFCLLYFPGSFPQNKSNSLLFRTETKHIHSNTIDDDFEIYISFPADYFLDDTTVYPVLYCMDGRYINVNR